MQLRLEETSVIYRNPLPGHQAVAATHPFVCPLGRDELLASYKVGSAQYARDNMVHLSRSLDGGLTWQHQGAFRDRAKDARPYQYSSGQLTLLRAGTLLMNNWRCDRSNPNTLYTCPKTGGSLPLELAVYRSHDGGRTWSEPIVGLTPDPEPGWIHAWGGPVIELDDGRWMQLAEPWLAYGSTRPVDVYTYALFSSDEGRTWGEKTIIANGLTQDRGYSHGHIVRRQDGRFTAVYWTMNAAMSKFHGLAMNASLDSTGKKWTGPQMLNIPGQSSYPVILDERRMAVIYSERDSKRPGIRVVLSDDGGRTWGVDEQVTVWDAYGRESLGVPPTDTYPGSHDVIAYGAPHLARVDEQTLIASWWCTQSADTHVRFARLRVEG